MIFWRNRQINGKNCKRDKSKENEESEWIDCIGILSFLWRIFRSTFFLRTGSTFGTTTFLWCWRRLACFTFCRLTGFFSIIVFRFFSTMKRDDGFIQVTFYRISAICFRFTGLLWLWLWLLIIVVCVLVFGFWWWLIFPARPGFISRDCWWFLRFSLIIHWTFGIRFSICIHWAELQVVGCLRPLLKHILVGKRNNYLP